MNDWRFDVAIDEVDYTMRTPPMHVYPVVSGAATKHEMHGWCWCQPLVENPTTGGRIYIHRRSLDSPHIEVEP